MCPEKNETKGVSRRDFLGLASMGAAVISLLVVVAGVFRMTKANVYYEDSKKFKVGKPEEFPIGAVKKLDDRNVFIFANSDGLHAISSVCTHLGCIIATTEWGFQCPCHGSQFDRNGKVIGGPAPRSLPWLEVSRHVDGNIVVDAGKEIRSGTKFKIHI
jgi:cytochrome b6-f complex iron-sulfur subunit